MTKEKIGGKSHSMNKSKEGCTENTTNCHNCMLVMYLEEMSNTP